jgi:hypothetical protein
MRVWMSQIGLCGHTGPIRTEFAGLRLLRMDVHRGVWVLLPYADDRRFLPVFERDLQGHCPVHDCAILSS